jgi:Tfp pilus assembly PilM family ATPase
LDEIIYEAKKQTQLDLPHNFAVVGLEVMAQVESALQKPHPQDSIDIDFYVFREPRKQRSAEVFRQPVFHSRSLTI